MIHLFKFKDHYIVLDINSGAIHSVSEVVFDVLVYCGEIDRNKWAEKKSIISVNHIGDHDSNEIKEAVSAIDYLIDNGMLLTDDSHITQNMLEQRDAVIKAMCLHVAHDCNMRCDYCFADEGAFFQDRSKLSFETGKKAIDFLLEKSGSRQNLEIDFFGGEPLMNFEVIKKLVQYGRERERKYGKNIRFTITTNGMLMDEEKERFINSHMDNVILSIDGRKNVNDRMRKTIGGEGTYDKIIKNFKRFAENRTGTYYVRGTFTGYNLDFMEDVKHLADMGFRNISVEPVVTDESMDYAISKEHIPRIFSEYDKLADLYLDYAKKGRQFAFFHFNMDLEQGPCIIKRVSGCGAGTEYVAISPEGDIYPCHQFVGDVNFKIGNLEDRDFKNKFYDKFNKTHIYNKPECMQCWAKFYCSGGCHANSYHANGDLLEPYNIGCELERKRVECAIGIQAVISDSFSESESATGYSNSAISPENDKCKEAF